MTRGRVAWQPNITVCINLAAAIAEQIPVRKLPKHIGISGYLLRKYFSDSLVGYAPIKKVRPKKKRGRKKGVRDTSRDTNICNMYVSGITLQAIGDKYGVTKERIRQIVKLYGITGKDGGRTTRARERARVKAIKDKQRSDQLKHDGLGCDLNEWKYYRAFDEDYYKTPIYAFTQQRYNARRRDIEWNMTITEWWSVWEKSGKWDQRGRTGESYVMGRHGDIGGYKIGNVKIITVSENVKEYYRLHMDEWRQKMIDAQGWDE